MADRPSRTADPIGADPDPPPGDAEPRRRSTWRELPVLVLSAVLIAVLIKSFLVQAFFIPSPSMVPTLRQGDRILVCRICLRLSDIDRGDILVFSDPSPQAAADAGLVGGFLDWLGEGIGVAHPDDEDFVKRVGALAGQTWEIRDGRLFVDGAEVDEPYLNQPTDTRDYGPETVPDGMMLMLGDNRLQSSDSRTRPEENGLGYVPLDTAIGKAFLVVWPPSRMGWLH